MTLANIPASLGYYPTDSLVLVHWREHDSEVTPTGARGQLSSGPIVRIDIDNSEGLAASMEVFETFDSDLLTACWIGEPSPAQQRELEALCAHHGVCLTACWQVSDIAVGNPIAALYLDTATIRRIFGHAHDTTCSDDRVSAGVVGSIIDSQSMRELSLCGEIPALSKQEACEFIPPDPANEQTTATCFAHAEAFIKILRAHSDLVAPAVVALGDLLAQKPECSLVQPLGPLPDDESNLHRLAAIEWVAMWLAHTSLRDICIAEFLRYPVSSREWALKIAANYTGHIRANAFCVYSLCVAESALTYRIPFCLRVAEQESPNHGLTGLLIRGYEMGKIEKLVAGAIEGSKEMKAWAQSGDAFGNAGLLN
ncbi:MAG: DUF4192 family protein [Corynebacterium sp.]|nr:DUF4192 family protein [Corynebacterium sp.]